jgi:predicted RNase H-like nuclease (RuvC/YqgF family)
MLLCVFQLQKAYLQKSEEVFRLKQQLQSRDRVIKELESQLHRLRLRLL